MITDELRERVKLLVAYDEYKAKTDAVTGYNHFDFPISNIKVDGYVVTVILPNGRYFFLPIRNYHIIEEERRLEQEKIKKEREKKELEEKLKQEALRKEQEKQRQEEVRKQREKEELFLKNYGERLERVARQAANRKTSPNEEGKIDGVAWWRFMEKHYPNNYSAANAFYSYKKDDDPDAEKSPIVKKFLSIAPDATINDFFPAIGLPTIKAVDGKISVNDEVVASYDGFRINMRGNIIQYRDNRGDIIWE